MPIAVKAVAIWLEEVTVENLSEPLAQYSRTAEVGSLSVLTCIVAKQAVSRFRKRQEKTCASPNRPPKAPANGRSLSFVKCGGND